MKLILTGATGFAGGEVLKQALADPAKNGSDNRLLDNRAIVVWPAWTPR